MNESEEDEVKYARMKKFRWKERIGD